MSVVNEDPRMLLHSGIPSQISKLDNSIAQLERVAAHCEASYCKASNKDEALNETKMYTLQSLASVAYYVNELSDALLRSLRFQTENLAFKSSEIQNINQAVAIDREKTARREIGSLAVSYRIYRQNKIISPAVEEKPPRYQRTPIDYSILDGIGHGQQGSQEYSSQILNRTGSSVSNELNGGNIYDHYHRGNQNTLTRNSIRSMADQYRVPQIVSSAASMESEQHYQRYAPSLSNNHSALGCNNGDAVDFSYASVNGGRSIRMSRNNFNLQSDNGASLAAQAQYRLSSESVERFPPPPSESVTMMNTIVADDPLPPPPPMGTVEAAEQSHYGGSMLTPNASSENLGWIPTSYIEKARVLYSYEASRPDELTLIENAIVFVLHKNDDGWFEGVLDGVAGLFPGNYVTRIPE